MYQVQSIQWTGNNGTFSDAAKWTGNTLPTDLAEITSAGNYYVAVITSTTFNGNITVGDSLTSFPTLVISSGVTFQVNGDLVLNSGSLTVQTGAVLILNGFKITSGSALSLYLDYQGTLSTKYLSLGSGWITFNGYGFLDLTNAMINMVQGNLLLTTSVTVKMGNQTQFSPFTAFRLSGPFNVISSITTSTLFEFGYAATITVDAPFVLTLTRNILIDPSTGNTVIVNGNIRCESSLTLNTGSITLQTGTMRVGQTLILQESTQFIGDVDNSKLALGDSATIFSNSTVTVFANIDAEGTLNLNPASGQVLYISGKLFMVAGSLNVKGSIVIAGDLSIGGSAVVSIPSSGVNKLTFNPNSNFMLGSSASNQVSGAGYLVLLQGSAIQSTTNCVITNPTILQASVSVKSGSSFTFSGTLSIANGTSFTGVSGNEGYVYFKSSVDMANDGEVTAEHKLVVSNVNVVVDTGSVVYFPTGVLTLESGANFIVNGTFYTTFFVPVLIEGLGTMTIASSGTHWVTAPVTISAMYNNYGTLKLNAGYLILTGSGDCQGVVSHWGYLEIRGSWNIGSCRPLGNGTVHFNAPTTTNQILPAGNYSFGVLRFGGKSVVSTQENSDYGFNIKANIVMEGQASLVIASNSILRGDVVLSEQASLTLKGTSTVLRAANVEFGSTSNIFVEAVAGSNSQIIATGAAKLGGKLTININGADVVNEITVVTYSSKTGAFDSLTANSASNLFYTMRYDAKKAVAVNTKQATTGMTSSVPPMMTTEVVGASSTTGDSFTASTSANMPPTPNTPTPNTPTPTPNTPAPTPNQENSAVRVIGSLSVIFLVMIAF